MAWVEIISAISAIIVAGAAVVAARSAKGGLDTWRRQMRGEDEYKLARDLLASLYKYRDAVHSIRLPWMFLPMPPEDLNKGMKENSEEEKKVFKAVLRGYQRKWDAVVEQKQRIYSDLVVAEALWGNELYALFKKLFQQVDSLPDHIQQMLRIADPDIPDDQAVDLDNPVASRERHLAMRALVLSQGDRDEFGKKIDQNIQIIEQYIRGKGHLNQNSS